MTWVPRGCPSSQFMLMVTIHRFDTVCGEENTLASILKKAFCVDLLEGADILVSLDIYKRSKTIMRDAGMNLRKWKQMTGGV